MPSLRELQRDFVAAIIFDEPSAAAAMRVVAEGVGVDARMAIYRNNVRGNYRRALGATFPVLKRLVGAPFFDAAVDAFVRDRPSTRGDINGYGVDLPAFLDAYAPARELVYLGDIARLEWAIDQANIAADAPPLDLSALGALPGEVLGELRFSLHPSASLVKSPYPLFRIWQVNQPSWIGDEFVDLAEGSDTLLVFRGDGGVTIERLAAADATLLEALANGGSLGDSAAAAIATEHDFDLPTSLRRYVASGLLVTFHTPAPDLLGPASTTR